jgi:hypothetical protein
MNHKAATLSIDAGALSGGSKRAFARHFGEMVLAMFLGMLVLGDWRSSCSRQPAAACPTSRAALR